MTRRYDAGPRTRRGRPIVRERRGAVLAWAALMVLAMVGFGALAVDFGSFYVTAAELQTAADAGALAGARALQVSTATTAAAREAQVDATAAGVTNANQAWGKKLSIDGNPVVLGWWTPAPTSSFSLTIPAGKTPNAVRVTATRQTGFLFGNVLKNVFGTAGPPLIERQAIAWVANVVQAECVQPWALPYYSLHNMATNGTAAMGTTGLPDLTRTQIANFNARQDGQRLITVLGPDPDNEYPLTSSVPPYEGWWRGFNYDGNAGKPSYQDGIIACEKYPVDVDAENGKTLPAQSGVYEKWTEDALVDGKVCNFKSSQDARCFNSGSTVGVERTVAWGDEIGNGPSGRNGSGAIDFRTFSTFTLICYFRGNANETCADSRVPTNRQSGYPKNKGKLPRGTMIGIANRITSANIGPQTEFGNTTSLLQRLLLVR